jgi:serine/threonine protein kinase
LEAALEQEPAGRTAFLRENCGSDHELLTETEALLYALDSTPNFLREPISQILSQRADVPQDAFIGSAVGPWKLLHHIGTGGTASVYAAARNDQEFRKIVAIKIIKPGMDSEEILRRFRTERQILAGLDHPNITRLLDGGSTATGAPYLAMEYVEGLPVTEYADTRKLSVPERLHLFCTICDAVDYAHRNLVVHRDLKPGNILVTAEGFPKLLDFGIAKILRAESTSFSVHFTQLQARMLTPEYASPEQVRGDPITTASDIYSLGVILYELLTGQRPYRLAAWTSSEIEQVICEREPQRPSTMAARLTAVNCAEGTPAKLARRLRGDLDAIVLTAMRKEPQRRYATVDRLHEDIRRHLRGMPVNASGNNWSYRVGKFVSRHKVGVAVTAVVALILVAATVISTSLARQLSQQKEAALQLVSFILGGYDTALKTGSTPARKASLDEVLANLNQLSPDSATDPKVRDLLVKAYLKIGGLQGDMFENNLGDAASARESYQRAASLARSPDDIAAAALGLGNVINISGDHRAALAQYEKAEQVLTRAARRADTDEKRGLLRAQVWHKKAFVQAQLGNVPQALDCSRNELQVAQQLSQRFPLSMDARRELALAEEHMSDVLQQTGDEAEALSHLQPSLGVYDQLLKLDPESADRRFDVAIGELQIAQALNPDKLSEAEEHYRRSLMLLERLVSQDPQNELYQRNRNSNLQDLMGVLYEQGKRDESRRMTEYALSVLQPLIHKSPPAAHDLHQYCWDLLNTPFQDLHRPKEVLEFAQKAADLTRHEDPSSLNLLALAWEENGNLAQAIATGEEALAKSSAGAKRTQIEENLARFRKKAAPQERRKN